MKKERKDIFVSGAISPKQIANSIANHETKTHIGAHQIFLGQVRADTIEGKQVAGIEYSAHNEMANAICHEIRESVFHEHDLSCMHIHHSIGVVKTGEISFFVFISSAHRTEVFEALPKLVNRIKKQLPIFGKEIFEDQTYQWKENK